MNTYAGHCSHVTNRIEPVVENCKDTTPDFGAGEVLATVIVGANVEGFVTLIIIGSDVVDVVLLNGRKPRLWLLVIQFRGSRHSTYLIVKLQI